MIYASLRNKIFLHFINKERRCLCSDLTYKWLLGGAFKLPTFYYVKIIIPRTQGSNHLESVAVLSQSNQRNIKW